MTTYVALLRGINVGGSGKLPMARLRHLASELGFDNPRTYVQSGNLVFSASDGEPPAELHAKLENALEKELGARCAVALLTAAHMADVVTANPFADKEAGPTQIHVGFRLPAPGRGEAAGAFGPEDDPGASLDRETYLPEQWAIAAGHLYLYLPSGIGRSKLAAALTKRADQRAGDPAKRAGEVTMRNWRTVQTLATMAAEQGPGH